MSIPLPPEITATQLSANYPALQIETPLCSATLALHGAHLTHWQPSHTNHPVLYTSPTAVYHEGKAVRGGIPICWPWFNAHPTQPKEHPSHGVARNRFWELESANISNSLVEIILSLTPSVEITPHVSFPFSLKAKFLLGKTCNLILETTNLSPENQAIGGALHTYLAVSNSSEAKILGLQNTPYLDTTTQPEKTNIQKQNSLQISEETDRIYFGTQTPLSLHDPNWQRSISVTKANSLSTVVWNPWLEKATALQDLPDQAYRDFICIEASNARQDTRILPPSAVHRLSTTLEVTPS